MELKIKRDKKQKETSYFIALLKKRDLIFLSWKIDNPKWKKRIEIAQTDPSMKEFLFVDIVSVEKKKHNKIDTIPVFGLENNWHIFVKKEYHGKRLIFNLSYRDKKGKFSDLLNSIEIDIPLALEDIEADQTLFEEKSILMELSEINSAILSGSQNSSW
ncbi:MAG: hypothetical protein V1874_01555 [Spirochaetota bacterium]